MKLMFFTVYWCQLIVQLKVQFLILMSVPEIIYWIKKKEDNILVKLVQTVFGLDFLVADDKKGSSIDYLKYVYYVSLFISLYST